MKRCVQRNSKGCHVFAICHNDTVVLTTDDLRNQFFRIYKENPPKITENALKKMKTFLRAHSKIPVALILGIIDEVIFCREKNQDKHIRENKIHLMYKLHNSLREMNARQKKHNMFERKLGSTIASKKLAKDINNEKNGIIRKLQSIKNQSTRYEKHAVEIEFYQWLYNLFEIAFAL